MIKKCKCPCHEKEIDGVHIDGCCIGQKLEDVWARIYREDIEKVGNFIKLLGDRVEVTVDKEKATGILKKVSIERTGVQSYTTIAITIGWSGSWSKRVIYNVPIENVKVI